MTTPSVWHFDEWAPITFVNLASVDDELYIAQINVFKILKSETSSSKSDIESSTSQLEKPTLESELVTSVVNNVTSDFGNATTESHEFSFENSTFEIKKSKFEPFLAVTLRLQESKLTTVSLYF